jgi:hypothetical protein
MRSLALQPQHKLAQSTPCSKSRVVTDPAAQRQCEYLTPTGKPNLYISQKLDLYCPKRRAPMELLRGNAQTSLHAPEKTLTLR